MQQNKQLDENVNQAQSVKNDIARGGAVSSLKLSENTCVGCFFNYYYFIVVELFSESVLADTLYFFRMYCETHHIFKDIFQTSTCCDLSIFH